jgi:hypothetical protein
MISVIEAALMADFSLQQQPKFAAVHESAAGP